MSVTSSVEPRGLRILMTCAHRGIHSAKPSIIGHLTSSLREAGHEVDTAGWGRHCEGESGTAKLLGRCSDLVGIGRRLARGNYDVLFVHTQHDWRTLARDIPLAAVGRRHARAVVLEFHGSQSNRLVSSGELAFRAATRSLLRRCHGVLLLSTEELTEWRRFYGKRAYYVVRNPFSAEELLAKLNACGPAPRRPDLPNLLFVGRLIREKGIYELLSATASILRECLCHLVLVGDGPESERVRQRIEELGIAEHTTLAGYLTGGALMAAYRAATFFTLPSYSEGFPTVISEAMAAGLPVVTTGIRGAADHLGEGVNALFVPPRDAEALARALRRLIQDAGLRARMSAANLAKVREFAPSIVVHDYVAAMRDVLGAAQKAG
jgi:glycosyltransferase involved in cell wall biosynthesis